MDESEHMNPVEQARDELLSDKMQLNAGKKVIESQRELMDLFWQRIDLYVEPKGFYRGLDDNGV